MGLALLKFDSWIKSEVKKYKEKSLLLYRGTPYLFESRKSSLKRESLYEKMKFPKLRDDEIFWLKGVSVNVEVGKGKKSTLFQSGELDLTYMLYPVAIKKGETAVNFVRIVP